MSRIKTYYTLLATGLTAFSGLGFYSVKTGNTWSQITLNEYDAIIEKTQQYFEGNNLSFSMDVSISSYKTHTTPVAYETKQGYVIQSGKNYHHYMMGVHSLQNKNYRFVVDSTEKNIMVGNPSGTISEKIMLSDYAKFHSSITKVYLLQLKEMDKVKVEFKENMKVSHIEMEFDKKGLMKKTISYFRVKLKDPTEEGSVATAPRIETIFRNYKSGISIDYQKEFDESNYFSVIKGKFVASKTYADYKIKDTRLKTK